VTKRQGLGDGCPDVVTGYDGLRDLQAVEEGDQVVGQDLGRVPVDGAHIGLVGIAEPAEVRAITSAIRTAA
jgi:hypothetical protein